MMKTTSEACSLLCALILLSLPGCSGSESDSSSSPQESQGSARVASDTGNAGQSSDAKRSGNGESAGPPADVDFVAPPLTAEEVTEGWVSLFDGRTLFGWDVPSTANWRVEDAAIVADEGEKCLLLTPFDLDDFELRCRFHLAPGGNSGIFLRTALNAANPATDTYELNICDSHATHRSGSLVARHVATDVPPVEGAWHSFRVVCEGPRIQVWLDDKPIVDFTDTSEHIRLTGRLGLQFNQGRAAYRDVCVRPLKFQPLWNSVDLTGWRPVPGSKSDFTVKEGLLHVGGGPGFLETEGTWSDFALKVTARLNGDGLNSGVFFRAKPGTESAPSHGYELQLNNAFKDGNRSRPADSGTGAIFRRVPARYVPASDREFFTAVLIAQQDRFATWVNGFQVVNWVDTRKDHENPREGRRLLPGHLSLQGHDPGTDVDFRRIDLHSFSGPSGTAQ